MWLQALFSLDDFQKVLGSLTPLRIGLAEDDTDRFLYVGKPTAVDLVPGQGIRISTHAKLRWQVSKIHVPIRLRTVTLLLKPSIAKRNKKDVLAFTLTLEDADLNALPGVLDRKVVKYVNEALQKESAQLVWSFMDTLDFDFKLPKMLAPAEKFLLASQWGEVRVTKEGIALAVSFKTGIQKAKATAVR
ncbi:MAG: hypothetical protein U0169_22180 [Polyangiaceae bacterium]